jgi:hypothetical protein
VELCVDQDVSAKARRGGGRGKLSSWGEGARSAKLSSRKATTVQQNLEIFADIQEKNDALSVVGTHHLQNMQHLQHPQQTVASAEREVHFQQGDEVSGVLLQGGGGQGEECAGEVGGRTHTHTHTHT